MADFKKTPSVVLKRWHATRHRRRKYKQWGTPHSKTVEGITMEWTGHNNWCHRIYPATTWTPLRAIARGSFCQRHSVRFWRQNLCLSLSRAAETEPHSTLLLPQPLQVSLAKPIGTRHVAMNLGLLATPDVVMNAEIATSPAADCYTARSSESSTYIKNARAHARASDIGKEKTESHAMTEAGPRARILNGWRYLGAQPGDRSA